MNFRLLLEFLVLISILLWYSIGSVIALKKKGFDPSLVTMISPFNFRGKLGLRLVLAVNLIACLLVPLSQWPFFFTSLVTFGLALIQILLLLAFNRSATQPTANYYLIALVGLPAIKTESMVFNLVFLSAIAVLQEYFLNRFSRNRQKKYDNWVEKQAHQINRQFGSLRTHLSDEEWFHTLHIAVTENIARPKISRLGESIYFHLKHPPYISSGIMQVQADKLLSDQESLERGSIVVSQILKTAPDGLSDPIERLKWLAKKYSGSVSQPAIDKYTGFLLSTYPGLRNAWLRIMSAQD